MEERVGKTREGADSGGVKDAARVALYIVLFLLLLSIPVVWLALLGSTGGASRTAITLILVGIAVALGRALFRLLDRDAQDRGTIARIVSHQHKRGVGR